MIIGSEIVYYASAHPQLVSRPCGVNVFLAHDRTNSSIDFSTSCITLGLWSGCDSCAFDRNVFALDLPHPLMLMLLARLCIQHRLALHADRVFSRSPDPHAARTRWVSRALQRSMVHLSTAPCTHAHSLAQIWTLQRVWGPNTVAYFTFKERFFDCRGFFTQLEHVDGGEKFKVEEVEGFDALGVDELCLFVVRGRKARGRFLKV